MHDVRIGAPRDLVPDPAQGRGSAPLLLQRSDDDFLAATLEDLRSPASRRQLAQLRAKAHDGHKQLKLFQPIQRQFHVALVEAWCQRPGTPRVDPARLAGAGLVLRRRDPATGQLQGWMRSQGRVRGWLALSSVGGDQADPQAARRLLPRLTGVADLDRELLAQAQARPDNLLEEDVIGLYAAPPDICQAAGHTYYYGLVPTVSSELAEAAANLGPAPGLDFSPGSRAFQRHLVMALRGEEMELPTPGGFTQLGWLAPDGEPANKDEREARLVANRFVLLLRQLSEEFDAFGKHPASLTLRRVLHRVALPLVPVHGHTPKGGTVPADTFLEQACEHLVRQTPGSTAVRMPARWPVLSPDLAAELARALAGALEARSSALGAKAGRFDDPGARYIVQAFVRTRPEADCAHGHIVWSEPSEPFVIAPWYEGAGAPPVQIALPDPGDRAMLAALKPNVSFVVPPSLNSLMSGSPQDLLAGKGTSSPGGLTWLCSFNIPIITICAFIVLNIFLTLFNLVFGWLPMMKICLPLPKIPPQEPLP
ncbi:MAG: hypothetical protein RJA44_751 [Pseudomonadota bacterium]